MQSNFLKYYILEDLIYFESEDTNYFQNAYSSDVDNIVYDEDDEDAWCTMDMSTSEKPLTVLLDLEATAKGRYTGKVKGFYLFDINIQELKTYEGDQKLMDYAEYYTFDTPQLGLIKEVESPIEEVSWGYTKECKEKILSYLCS